MTLPEGMTLNPSSADGLTACSEQQVGVASKDPVLFDASKPACPDSSKVGTVQVETPLLPEPLNGSLFVGTPYANPFHALLGGYLVIEGEGVLIKLAGRFTLDPSTGRITAMFDENPQQPFNEMRLRFTGGEHGVLITPSRCGSYATDSQLTPWSKPQSPVSAASTFTIDQDCGTGGFAPTFTAGTAASRAGAFSPFLASFSRTDAESHLAGLRFTLPPGATAKLAGVPLCSDADASTGNCPDASRIGSVTAGAGAGSPIYISGTVYLTGPYNGGPFGVAVVVPANAGPFHLGNVVVRGAIRIDPHTAQASILSDAFPQFIGTTGVPTDVRRVDVNIDRPGFTLNPTNCNEMNVTGTLTATTGQEANVSQRFQAADCASLAFKPTFKAYTTGKTSRNNGASLNVKLTYPTNALGKDTNIKTVKVNLPKQLPSRLTTLQKACTSTQFQTNPAGCPTASVIGHATATTPILTDPLTGPAYFVSHGGAKFPELIIVLQADGITIDLQGETFISKTGITSSTFHTVPDQPVTSFELTLPQGPNSALAANGNLCTNKLTMPTQFTGQNGATIKQTTPITVTGCPKKKPKKAKKARKASRRHSPHHKAGKR